MENLPPPVLQSPVQQKKRHVHAVIITLLVVLILLVASLFVMPAMFGRALLALMAKESQLSVKLGDGQFKLTVLEAKLEPNYFTEKIRVRCEKDMEVGIGVTDLKQAGFFQVAGTNGEQFYREGNPRMVGQSSPIESKDGVSTCDVLFKVSTNPDTTGWHSEVAGATCDTAIQTPLTVSDIRTNWPGSYDRGSSIPLASLGGYKILISIK